MLTKGEFTELTILGKYTYQSANFILQAEPHSVDLLSIQKNKYETP